MDKNVWTKVLLVVGGAVIGSVATYFAVKGKYERLYQQEISEYRNRDRSVPEQELVNPPRTEKNSYSVQSETPEQVVEKIKQNYRYISEKSASIKSPDIMAFVGETPEDDEDPGVSVEELEYREQQEIVSDYNDLPYVISRESFEQDCLDYDKDVLHYYDEEDILDYNGEIIFRYEHLIGADGLDRFGDLSDCATVVYIRNEVYDTDFKISKLSTSYVNEALGFKDPDKKGPGKMKDNYE